MPFINTKTNTKITEAQEIAIKTKFGSAISALGKSEGWLMLNFEDECRLWFKGDNSRKKHSIPVLFGKVRRVKRYVQSRAHT